jgi:hypothetical protein
MGGVYGKVNAVFLWFRNLNERENMAKAGIYGRIT